MNLIDRTRIEIKLSEYGVAPATALSEPLLLSRVQDYRRQAAGRIYPLSQEDIRKKVSNAEYYVSRKIDGEFAVLVYREGDVFTLNPGGTVRVGLPFLQEAADLLKANGITEAMFAGELHVAREDGKRSRVHDVITVSRQPKSDADLQQLHFAVFDVISLDNNPPAEDYPQVWQQIEKLFSAGERINPVPTEVVKESRAVESLFQQWAIEDGGEGVVARSISAGTFKIKPQHNLDAVVIGFTESADDREGLLHDMLLAVMRPDGALQVLSRVGGGFNEDQRREILSDLKDRVVESEYTEVNSDHVAYQMVKPEVVIEISCLDLVSETTRGGTINRMVLDWDADDKTYRVVRRMPCVSVISPQFIRIRDDKTANVSDIRISQLTNLVDVPHAERDARAMTLPQSQVLKREVFTKVQKDALMVRKFVLWKTNKETDSDDYPAYVLHYTDFSPNRKSPLSRDIRVSSSESQIIQLLEAMIADNIKKGWNRHEISDAELAAPVVASAKPATVADSAQEADTQTLAEVTAADPLSGLTVTKKPTKKATAKKSAAREKAAKKKAAKKKAAASKTAATKKTVKKKAVRKKAVEAAPPAKLAESERTLSNKATGKRKKKSG